MMQVEESRIADIQNSFASRFVGFRPDTSGSRFASAARQKFLDSSPPLNPPFPPVVFPPLWSPRGRGDRSGRGTEGGQSPLLPVSYPPSTGDYRGVEAGWGKTVHIFLP